MNYNVGDVIVITNYRGDTRPEYVTKGKRYKVIATANYSRNYIVQVINDLGRPWWIYTGTYVKEDTDLSKYSEIDLIKSIGYPKTKRIKEYV